MTAVCDELEQVKPHIKEEEDTRFDTIAPYDSMFHRVADRMFSAISCRCDPNSIQEIRLRLGTFKTKALNIRDRTLDVLLLYTDEGEDFWHSIRLHAPTICQ